MILLVFEEFSDGIYLKTSDARFSVNEKEMDKTLYNILEHLYCNVPNDFIVVRNYKKKTRKIVIFDKDTGFILRRLST